MELLIELCCNEFVDTEDAVDFPVADFFGQSFVKVQYKVRKRCRDPCLMQSCEHTGRSPFIGRTGHGKISETASAACEQMFCGKLSGKVQIGAEVEFRMIFGDADDRAGEVDHFAGGEIVEKEEHCGEKTVHYRGIKLMSNDLVNLLSTAFAAALAALAALLIK